IVQNKWVRNFIKVVGKLLWFLFDSSDESAKNVLLAVNSASLSNKPGKSDFFWKSTPVQLNLLFNEESEENLKKITLKILKEKN
ncbi:hypothetical protein TUBRATIS_24080, partial [Tubulinosema ratisbonensis]